MTEKPAPLAHPGVVDLQLAIFEVAAQAKGLSVAQARQLLAAAVARQRITPPSGLWIDAAATSAAMGEPYIISNEARWAVEAHNQTGAHPEAPDRGSFQ